MQIVIFEAEPWEHEAFDDLRERHEVEVVEYPLNRETAARHAGADVISTFIYSRLEGHVLERFERLKLIATRSTGIDHIALDVCEARGIRVAHVPSYGTHTVAEHAFGLLLAISHRIVDAADRTRKGDFSPKGLQGFDLAGKTLGVVGTGDIGLHMARIGRGFSMRVVAFDVRPKEREAAEIGFEYRGLDDLLRGSDVVSLHVPGNEKTHHLIAEREFDLMKPGAVILNTSRGTVIRHTALLRALADGKLAGAGLDVLPEEPTIREEAELLRSIYERTHNLENLLANHVLTHMRNVVVTPHSAFNTKEAMRRILDTTIENIRAFAEGEPERAALAH